MNIKTQIESILFLSNKPLSAKQLADLVGIGRTEVETILQSLQTEYQQRDSSGIEIVEHDHKFQMTTAAASAGAIEKFLKQELTGEMTRPQLETLTIIAYRAPITKTELEQIRGVNCSLILRNLQIRGLVESMTDKTLGTIVYNITSDFVRFLGLTHISQLPDYEKLSMSETLENLLQRDEERKMVDSIHQ